MDDAKLEALLMDRALGGMSAEMAAISCAGTVLSQPPSRTAASIGWALIISSVSIAARLR